MSDPHKKLRRLFLRIPQKVDNFRSFVYGATITDPSGGANLRHGLPDLPETKRFLDTTPTVSRICSVRMALGGDPDAFNPFFINDLCILEPLWAEWDFDNSPCHDTQQQLDNHLLGTWEMNDDQMWRRQRSV